MWIESGKVMIHTGLPSEFWRREEKRRKKDAKKKKKKVQCMIHF